MGLRRSPVSPLRGADFTLCVRSADSTLGLTQFLSPADQVAREPAVAVDPDGEAVAVWKETTTGNASNPDSEIHAAVGRY
jgi:hypothetical protein